MENAETLPLILKVADWPVKDQLAIAALYDDGDILLGRGPCYQWAEGSRTKRQQSYGRWLGYHANRGLLGDPICVADRATPENIVAFIDNERSRCSGRTVYMMVEDLWFLFRALNPNRDWSWLHHMVLRLRAVADIGYLKPHPGVNAIQIFEWALNRIKSFDDIKGPSDLDQAVRFRDGLQVGLLISTPVRSRTYVAVEIGRHLQKTTDGFVLKFKPIDIKDKKHHEYPLHQQLVEPMRRYLDIFRPFLLRGTRTDRLWISNRGAPVCADSFSGHLADLTLREFGEILRPHAFRHVAATTIALLDPKHVGIIADVLGHSSLAMSEKHYNHANNVKAVSRYQEAMNERKKQARHRDRERIRLADLPR